ASFSSSSPKELQQQHKPSALSLSSSPDISNSFSPPISPLSTPLSANSIGNHSEVDSGGQDTSVCPTTQNRDVNSLGEKSINNPDDAVSIISSDFSGSDSGGRKQYTLLRTRSQTAI